MNQPAISSRQNSLVKRVRDAIREHRGEIVLEGPKQVADAIAAGWKPIAILTTGEARVDSAVRAQKVSADVFHSLAATRTSQGVLALFERPQHSAAAILARRDSIAIALDGVQDPGNVGTIVRLAAAFDAVGVLLLPGCADPYGPKALRASVGAILEVPVASVSATELLGAKRKLLAADAGGHAGDPPSADAILVLGNEGTGVSEEIRAVAATIAIPMSSRVESLNVAASAAILLARSYALRR